MNIPMFKDFFRPVLEIFKDGNIYKVQEVAEKLVVNLKISENLQNERIKSGKTVIESRTYWTMNFIKREYWKKPAEVNIPLRILGKILLPIVLIALL